MAKKAKTLDSIERTNLEDVKAQYGMFNMPSINTDLENEELVNFLTYFPTNNIQMVKDENGVPVVRIFATPTDVAMFKGVNKSTLTQRADSDKDMMSPPNAPAICYIAVDLLECANNVGSSSRKGKVSFRNEAIEQGLLELQAMFAQVYSDFGMDFEYDFLKMHETWESNGDENHAVYLAEKAKAKALKELAG